MVKDSADSNPDRPQPRVEKEVRSQEVGDASRGEVTIYAIGNVDASISDRVPDVLQNILVVAAHVNPLVLGLVMALKTLWDGIVDPIMAYISDNTRSRFGRRRPYILAAGVSRVLFLGIFVFFLPVGSYLSPNQFMEAQRFADEASRVAHAAHETSLRLAESLRGGSPENRDQLIRFLEGKRERNLFERLFGSFLPDKEGTPLQSAQTAAETLQTYLPVLEQELTERKQLLGAASQALDALESEYASARMLLVERSGSPAQNRSSMLDQLVEKFRSSIETARDKVAASEARLSSIERAVASARIGQSTAIAAEAVIRHLLTLAGRVNDPAYASEDGTTSAAHTAMQAAGLPVIPVFALEVDESAGPAPKRDWTAGFLAFLEPANHDQRMLILYVLIGILIYTTLSSMHGVPYYALGIELSPSYNGRTQVVVYRSFVNHLAGLVAPWVPAICFSLVFVNAFDGLFWVAVLASIVGIPATLLLFFKTKERTQAPIKEPGGRPGIFLAITQIAREPEFLRILGLYSLLGLVNGVFAQLGFYLNVYWVMGSPLAGATLGAQISLLAWALSLATLPAVNWACKRFQKHRVLQFSVVWMAFGTALKWWLVTPENPYLQFCLPFFFSVGIVSVYTVLPSMMADVTDVDEHKYGLRREGMFGAVMSFLMRGIGTIVPIVVGAALVLSGFDAAAEHHQDPATIWKMRVIYSIIPAGLLLVALGILYKYPLTRDRVEQIKSELRSRRLVAPAASS